MRRASAIHPHTRGAPPRSAAQNEIVRALTGDVLRRAARCWNAPLDTLTALPAVQNFVYAMDSADGPAILRLTHERHRTAEEVEAELCWIADLAGRKLNVARPRRSRSGAWLEIIESTCGKFIATSFERAAGVAFDLSRPQRWNAKLFEAWGALIAQLHNAARESGWSEGSLRRPSWQGESVVRNFKLYVPQSEALVRTAFARVIRELNALPRSRASYGLIHADLNHDNLFFDDGRLVVFDFDDCCFCWFAYDLAVAIYHLPASETQSATNANAQRAFRWLLRGYGRVAQFDPEWLEWVPLFLKWRDLLIYGFFYEQLDIDSLPELFRKKFVAMRERIELGRPIADISGIR